MSSEIQPILPDDIRATESHVESPRSYLGDYDFHVPRRRWNWGTIIFMGIALLVLIVGVLSSLGWQKTTIYLPPHINPGYGQASTSQR